MDINEELNTLCEDIVNTRNSPEYYETYGLIFKCYETPSHYNKSDWDFGLYVFVRNNKTKDFDEYIIFRSYVECYDIESKYELNEYTLDPATGTFKFKNISGCCDLDDYDFENGNWTVDKVKISLLKTVNEFEKLYKNKIIQTRLNNISKDFKNE